MPRQHDDYNVNDEVLDKVSKYVKGASDSEQLQVNWEYLEDVQRTKNLRRINLMLDKQQIASGIKSVQTRMAPTIVEEPTQESYASDHKRSHHSPDHHESGHESLFNKTEVHFASPQNELQGRLREYFRKKFKQHIKEKLRLRDIIQPNA